MINFLPVFYEIQINVNETEVTHGHFIFDIVLTKTTKLSPMSMFVVVRARGEIRTHY